MKREYALFLALAMMPAVAAMSEPLSLDSCRALALANNKQMLVKAEQVKAAGYQKKEAFAAYLPAIDFAGGYMYNQKELSIFDSDQLLPVKTFNAQTGAYEFVLAADPATGAPLTDASGQYVPGQVALIPKESMTYDIHNLFFGALTLTQPLYMGGKIVAMNRITHYAEELAQASANDQAEKIVYEVDAAYWQVVSLRAKQKLAVSYVALLDSLSDNVQAMVNEGVATKSDKLSVDVKLNQAQVDLTKVDNALVLSRMALAQVCGLPIDTPMTLVDENSDEITTQGYLARSYDMQQVYENRQDVRMLELGVKISEQQKKVALSGMLPNLALVGSYSFSNPNLFDGFKTRFSGAFSVGAMLTIPLWHWKGDYSKYRAAEAEETIRKLELSDAKDRIELQVKQASFKAHESMKTYLMTVSNLDKADENLRQAQLGFKEGVMTVDDVMEAQTAWLKANSERIDAQIDVHLCDTYLSKVLGTLSY